jgi:heparanase
MTATYFDDRAKAIFRKWALRPLATAMRSLASRAFRRPCLTCAKISSRLRLRGLSHAMIAAAVLIGWPCFSSAQAVLHPQTMRVVAEVDPRFVSFNIEAVEVTGGRFWKPYKSKQPSPPSGAEGNQPAAMDASLFQYRPPIDLSNRRLRKLAAALGPSYLRVSGTWMNSTFFQNNDGPLLAKPPDGFKGVLSRAEWKGVVDFAGAVNAQIVTSVATSAGTRDAHGVWNPAQARARFEYTQQLGSRIAAAEFMNEPTFAAVGGAPQNYDAAAYAKDIEVFRKFLKDVSPTTLFLGPGSVGEGAPMIEGAPMPKLIRTEDMMRETGPVYDAFSYHYYGGVSKRCTAALGPQAGMTPEKDLTPEWFEKNVTVEQFYARLRDQYLPGKPMWLTETGEAACGGDPWASTFTDTFRFLDQLGALAQRGVKVVMENTLASSDYGLLDENAYEPRPNYWAALLWKRTMGARVLQPDSPAPEGLRVYAHCDPASRGGVTILVLNPGSAAQTLKADQPGARLTLSADQLDSQTVRLNGAVLALSPQDDLPRLDAEKTRPGTLDFSPLTITFLRFPQAHNASCTGAHF